MYIFLCILIVIACVLLIGVVLIQKSKGGGLASDYSGGNQYLGYRKTTDFIEKATWSLAIFICIVSIFASFAIKQPVSNSKIAVPAQQTAPGTLPTQAEAAPAATPAAPAAKTEAAPAATEEQTKQAPATPQDGAAKEETKTAQ